MRLIDIDDDRNCFCSNDGEYEKWNIDPDVLKDAITIEPEQRWIPVTERMPNHELALVQYSGGDFDLLQFPTAYRMKDMVAWMPLPEPWRGGQKNG